MNRLTKTALIPAVALGMAAPFATPAIAGESEGPIVVRSQEAMSDWQADTSAEINRKLDRATFVRDVRPNTSIVEASFTLGADGRAADIEITTQDGNLAARKATHYAVRNLENLADIPVADPSSVRFVANIVFADTEAEKEAMLNDLKSSARVAQSDDGETVVTLGG